MKIFRAWLQKWFGIPAGNPNNEGSISMSESPEEKKGAGFTILRVQPTPNPDAFQFVMSAPVISDGTKTFDNADDAKGSSFAEPLFQIFGVENVFLQENYVTVTKSATTGWHTLFEKVGQEIEKNLTFYETPDDPKEDEESRKSVLKDFNKEEFKQCTDEKKALVIEALLDQSIRPALANDGGGLDVLGIEGNVIKVHYQGACGSCPSSTAGTLQYIETFLRDAVHPNIVVRAS